jgi:hypothetical protein
MRSRLVPVLLVAVVAAFPGGAAAAWTLTRSGSGAAKAKTLGSGNTPTVSNQGHKVTVAWAASYFTTGGAVPGYVVRRYNAITGVGQGALNGCSGTISGLTCIENSVPTGSWQYTVTPAAGTNWRGTESAKSAVVVVG